MSKIKNSVGARWDDLAGAAYQIVEESIREFLTDDDTYERRDDEIYVLCFGNADKAEAEAITESIVREIKTRIADETSDLNIRVNHTVASLAWDDLERDDVTIADAIAEELRTISESAEAATAAWRRHILRNAQVRYAPMWSPASRVVSVHRVLLDEETGAGALKRMAGLSAADELMATLFDLDCLIIGRSIKKLHQLLQGGGKAQLLVPVNFNLLTDKQSRDRYLNLCRGIPDPYKRYLLFELHSIPAGTPTSRMIEIALALQAHASGIVVEVPATGVQVSDFAATAISGISANFGVLSQKLPEAGAVLTRLAAIATTSKLKFFLHGVDTIGLSELAIRAHVDLMDGRAIALTTDELKSAYRWKPQ
ncbi:MAG TPA: hypothetical protein VF175_18020 [Lacipirellula sp.]|jgi:hypothetical protein